MSKTLSPNDASKRIGIPAITIRRQCAAGKIPGAAQDGQGGWRIPETSLGSITSSGRGSYNEWTQHEIALLGTDTDPRIATLVGRTSEAVRDMRTRCGIEAFPAGRGCTPEMQIPRMTSKRLQELRAAIDAELSGRR